MSGGSPSPRDFWRAPAVVAALAPLGQAPSDADFRLLAENLPILCWIARADGSLCWYNRRWHEYCGTTAEQMADSGWHDVLVHSELPRVEAAWRASVVGGEPYELVVSLRGTDGVFRPFLTRAVPLRDATGVIVRWLGVNVEVGAQLRAEAARDASEAALREAKAEREFVIALIGRQRALADPESIMRLSAEQLGQRLGANRAGFHRILPDGRVRYVGAWSDWSLPPLTGERPAHIFGAAIERKRRRGETIVVPDSRADDAYTALAEAGVGAVVAVYVQQESDLKVGLYINSREAREWTSDEVALVHEVAELTWLAVERAEAMARLETRVVRQGEALAEAEGAVVVAESKVRQLQKMEAVGQLTGGIAHDFNNMLAVVIGALDMMKRQVARGNVDVGKYVEAAMDGATRAAALTQRLLAFSRQQALAPESIDANRMVGGLADLLTRTLGEAVRLETVLGAGLWRCRADPNELENVVVNLGVNARDAMPDGGRLTIETANSHLDEDYAREAEVAPGQYVLIAVSDTGTGMLPEVIARAFEPFFTTKGAGKGTGLGLSQVFGFVRQSGGHIRIYSEPGHGTTLKIYLPRDYGDTVAVARPKLAVATGATLPPGTRTEVVLVVEDEARVRALTTDALRDLGYSVIHAASGAEALKVIEGGQSIDLVFTDIVMPDMTGRQLADRAKPVHPALKVIFTTGYTRSAVVHNGVLDPGVHFLAKPFSIEQLARLVRQVLDEPPG